MPAEGTCLQVPHTHVQLAISRVLLCFLLLAAIFVAHLVLFPRMLTLVRWINWRVPNKQPKTLALTLA